MKTKLPFALLLAAASVACCMPPEEADKKADNAASQPSTTSKPTPDKKTPDTKTPPKAEAKIADIDVAAAAKLLKDDPAVVVLDIRTPSEFSAGHIKGAVNIDFKAEDFAERIAELDTSKTYLMHCASGGRSARSLPIFEKHGFTVHHLKAGALGWEAAKQPLEK